MGSLFNMLMIVWAVGFLVELLADEDIIKVTVTTTEQVKQIEPESNRDGVYTR